MINVPTNRAIRRALDKAKRRTPTARHHKDAREILSDGLGVYARLVEVSDAEHTKIELFLLQRLEAVHNGSENLDDWSCVVTALLEGYNIARAVADDTQRAELIREVKYGAKMFDMLRYHFQQTGEILEQNYEGMRQVILHFGELKRCGAFNRQDLLDVVKDIEKNFNRRIRELFDGVPRSGLIEIKYEQPKNASKTSHH